MVFTPNYLCKIQKVFSFGKRVVFGPAGEALRSVQGDRSPQFWVQPCHSRRCGLRRWQRFPAVGGGRSC